MMAVNMGRRLSSSVPPARASAILMRLRASQSSLMLTTMLCFSLLRTQASNSCSTRVEVGQSWALTTALVLHEFDACVRSSEKHNIVVSIKEDWEARSLIKMAEALAGGTEELKRRPMFTAIICTVSPLHQERFGMDLALVLAEAGIPVSFYPMPILGATGPVTIAGSAVVNNAEFVSGATLVQLAHPGATTA